MEKKVLLIIFLFTIGKLEAKENTWFRGSVVLASQHVVVGEISIEPNHDLILFRIDSIITVLPAHKLQSFQFYDAQANINRKFISVKDHTGVWRSHHLYEVVLLGEVSVLRKEKVFVSAEMSDADDFIYTLKLHNELVDMKSFRRKVYPDMRKKGGSLLSMFIIDHHLNPNKPANAIQIIQYYNALIRNDEALARQ